MGSNYERGTAATTPGHSLSKRRPTQSEGSEDVAVAGGSAGVAGGAAAASSSSSLRASARAAVLGINNSSGSGSGGASVGSGTGFARSPPLHQSRDTGDSTFFDDNDSNIPLPLPPGHRSSSYSYNASHRTTPFRSPVTRPYSRSQATDTMQQHQHSNHHHRHPAYPTLDSIPPSRSETPETPDVEVDVDALDGSTIVGSSRSVYAGGDDTASTGSGIDSDDPHPGSNNSSRGYYGTRTTHGPSGLSSTVMTPAGSVGALKSGDSTSSSYASLYHPSTSSASHAPMMAGISGGGGAGGATSVGLEGMHHRYYLDASNTIGGGGGTASDSDGLGFRAGAAANGLGSVGGGGGFGAIPGRLASPVPPPAALNLDMSSFRKDHPIAGGSSSTSSFSTTTAGRAVRTWLRQQVPGYESLERTLFSSLPGSTTGSKRRRRRNTRSFSFSLSPIPMNASDVRGPTKSYHLTQTGKGSVAGSSSSRRRSPRAWMPTLIRLAAFALLAWAVFRIVLRIARSRYDLFLQWELYNKPSVELRRAPEPPVQPLAGCFNPDRTALTAYDAADALYGPKSLQLSVGKGMKVGMECYDFAATLPGPGGEWLLHQEGGKVLEYHTYWRADLLPFSKRQAATLKSWLATQPLANSRLTLWSNDPDTLGASPWLEPILVEHSDVIRLRKVDISELSRGTELENSPKTELMWDRKAWVDGDAVRLLALWNFGGVWFDMDTLLTRNMQPLAEQEFVTQWDCYDRSDLSLNGAVMHFRKHSPYLCEAFHIMVNTPDPRPNSITWGSKLYQLLHRNLVAGHVKPFTVLPWCFVDPRNCKPSNSFPDPFLPDPTHWEGLPWKKGGERQFQQRLGQVWSIHLHNQYEKGFPMNGWVERLLQEYERKLAFMKEAMKGKGSEAAAAAAAAHDTQL